MTKMTRLVCPWCHTENSVAEWDAKTFKACTSREMKRNYVSLEKDKAYRRGTDTYYCCPNCNEWSGGWRLSIVRPGTDKKNIGCILTITFVPNNMNKAIGDMLNDIKNL